MSSLTLQCQLHLFSSFRDSVALWKGRIMRRWKREGHRWWGRRVQKMSVPLHPFPMGKPMWGPTRSVAWYSMPLELIVSRNWVQRETKPLVRSRREPGGKEASSPSFPVTNRYQHKCLSLTEGSYLYQCLGNFWESSHFGHQRGVKHVWRVVLERRSHHVPAEWARSLQPACLACLALFFLVGQDLSGGGGGHSTSFCFLGPVRVLAAITLSVSWVWVFSMKIFHPYVELYVCLVQFLPTYYGIHHERPFFFFEADPKLYTWWSAGRMPVEKKNLLPVISMEWNGWALQAKSDRNETFLHFRSRH